ncbi:hypothetical protein [Rufibacter tibetensis]|uniref:Lipoprotein n=1 Tax=Rufibacter tibetensis TaxID=512763 RepID=A0A0P0C1I4_9BACT|nr:hypothetical protein [Rufibacter tibetensis]ALI98467.1 hypothetical protein DC20_05095 [Rufibacter tibetensis]
MKTLRNALGLLFLFLASCQPDSPTTVSEEKESNVATKEEQRQQTDVLTKDTLNALQEEVVRKSPQTTQGNQADFEVFFRKFTQSIQDQDAEAFNSLIDPAHGLHIIQTPGAVPHFTYLINITTFRRADASQQPFFSISEEIKTCDLEEVKTLPTLTCEGGDNNFNRQGCFVAEASTFRKSEAYKYASLPADAELKAAQTQQLVIKTVLHTSSGFRFHFGQINGQWRVLFVDLSVPCSA